MASRSRSFHVLLQLGAVWEAKASWLPARDNLFQLPSYYTPSGRAAGTLSRPAIICVHAVWLRSPGDVVQGCSGSQSACLAGWQGSGVALLFLSHLVTQKHTRKALIHSHLSSPIPFTLSTVNMVISSFTSNLLLPLLPPSVGSCSCVEKRGLPLVTVPHYP